MGFYRFFLAVLVAIAHAGIHVYDYHQGVVAVISFYLLSGYVMTLLIEKYYKRPSAIPTFYLDRAARLFPQFLFYMVLASAFIYFVKVDSQFITQLTVSKWVLNFFMLPQGFYMYWADGAVVIPQSWSLGLEFTFYLVIPWILVYCSRKQIYLLAGASFIVFLAAYLGKIDTNYFGYRLLPGTLFMFLVGSSFSYNDKSSSRFRAAVFLSGAAMLLIAFLYKPLYQLLYNKEVLVGLLAGILAIGLLRHVGSSRIDRFFGDLSYGIYLNHFIVIWAMQTFLAVKTFDAAHTALLLLASCSLAWLSFHYVERPALMWRHALRNKARQRVSPAAQQGA
ncbi:MAG: acyltransferase [Pseudoxanthomonas sp.]